MNAKPNTKPHASSGWNHDQRNLAHITKGTTNDVHGKLSRKPTTAGFVAVDPVTMTHLPQTTLCQVTHKACFFQRTVHATVGEAIGITGCNP